MVSASSPGLNLEVCLDDKVFFDNDPYEAGLITVDLDDVDGQHELIFTMSGKTSDHTAIASDGTIINDLTLSIDNLCVDSMQLGQMMTKLSEYVHDFNGSQPTITDQFFGIMGCNGTVRLKFTTPIYLWLLENM